MSIHAAQPLWTGQTVLEVTGGSGMAQWDARGVSIDSRTLQREDLFVALKGEVHDGHRFLENAFAAGASAALVARQYLLDHEHAAGGGGAHIGVGDPLRALCNLAAHARARCEARVIAVTGSVGKTGIKDALGHVLSKSLSARVHVSSRSFNNHWGVPLSLARLPLEAQYGVFEVGMNHAGEISPLSRLIAPDIALISAVRPAHMEFFSSMEEVADAKAEIFDGLREGGTAVLGCDDPWFERLRAAAGRAGARLTTFGASPNADVRLLRAREHADGSDIELDIAGECVRYHLAVPGAHWISNSIAVLACCHGLGLDVADIAPSLASLPTPSGRGRRQRVVWGDGKILLIDESYNANPASMEAALATLGNYVPAGGGRRIIALGDMLELGDESRNWHLSLVPAVASAGISLVFTCGGQMRHLFEALPTALQGAHCSSASHLADCLEDVLREDDALMVKGSNGMGMKAIVERLSSGRRERER